LYFFGLGFLGSERKRKPYVYSPAQLKRNSKKTMRKNFTIVVA
jgi:hypothetical protein